MFSLSAHKVRASGFLLKTQNLKSDRRAEISLLPGFLSLSAPKNRSLDPAVLYRISVLWAPVSGGPVGVHPSFVWHPCRDKSILEQRMCLLYSLFDFLLHESVGNTSWEGVSPAPGSGRSNELSFILEIAAGQVISTGKK